MLRTAMDRNVQGPQYPSFAVLLASTNGVISGGITRGLLKGTATNVDAFSYPETNVPCGQAQDAAFTLVSLGATFLWGQARLPTAGAARPCAR